MTKSSKSAGEQVNTNRVSSIQSCKWLNMTPKNSSHLNFDWNGWDQFLEFTFNYLHSPKDRSIRQRVEAEMLEADIKLSVQAEREREREKILHPIQPHRAAEDD